MPAAGLISDKLTLRMLRYFYVLSQTRHFGQAADRLNITTSPLSHKIKELESLLGVTLFLRNSRNVELTEAGEALQNECDHLFQVVEHAVHRVQRVAEAGRGVVKLGLVSSAFWSGLGQHLGAFQQRYPDQQIDLVEANPEQQKRMVIEHQIDVGLVRFADAMNIHPLSARKLTEETFVVAMTRQHPLARHNRLSLDALRDAEFALFNRRNSASADLFINECKKRNLVPKIIKEFVEPNTLMAYVAHSDSVTIVPSSFANHGWDNIRFVPLKEAIGAGLYAIYDRSTLSPSAHAFVSAFGQSDKR
ncbi:transcriptional regulator, LysR family [Ferrimonas balearica DSM 9799]|uniref:Transcriptional regulator, LysR family n=1 Tax=Ferrimonas balearica (strain DSM 9799 / CCM 4581 / KCTC 23876 / PAT) TaxID=550540 RepID=E1SL52_FERBD|nr:LysR substrate-binding domain-containing protein [Ferrimonas balearica]ADN75430.1 transcriptional regulator, LysR family [Ferrimonas balearica DSM 9799]